MRVIYTPLSIRSCCLFIDLKGGASTTSPPSSSNSILESENSLQILPSHSSASHESFRVRVETCEAETSIFPYLCLHFFPYIFPFSRLDVFPSAGSLERIYSHSPACIRYQDKDTYTHQKKGLWTTFSQSKLWEDDLPMLKFAVPLPLSALILVSFHSEAYSFPSSVGQWYSWPLMNTLWNRIKRHDTSCFLFRGQM